MKSPTNGAVRAELGQILARFESGDARLKHAQTLADRDEIAAAEAERQDAMGEYWAASQQLGDLFILMLRYALEHRRESLALHLADALRPELEPLADAIARLEGK